MATGSNDADDGKWASSDNAIDVDFDKFKKFVCIQHPAVVENVDKAFDTLGGLKTVGKTCQNPNKRLELKWRPEDIYCKPTYGNRVNKDSLVMKVRRRRRKKKNEGMNDGEEYEYEYQIEVLGMINVYYDFQNMCDFQYLPTIQKLGQKPVSLLNQLKISDFVKQKEYLERDVPLFMPPVIFARMDVPADYLFRQNQFHGTGDKNSDLETQENLIGTSRRKRTIFTIFVGYHDATPTGPMEGASSALHSKVKNLAEAKQVVEEFFKERPIWSKNALRYRLDPKYLARLKFVLPLVSYFMTTGPWRVLWVKFGYDPRTDPKAKIYQTLDFRRRQRGAGDCMPIGHKRSTYTYSLPTAVNKPRCTIAQISTANLESNKPTKETPSQFLESTYKFRADVLPPYRQMFYQICDIEDDKVQELLSQNNAQETVCDEKEGWCIPDFCDLSRDILYGHVENIIAKTSFSIPSDASRRSRHVVAKMREFQLLEAASEEDFEDTVTAGQRKETEEHDDHFREEGPWENEDGEFEEEDEGDYEDAGDDNEMDTEMIDCV
ncbi:hypothetical protein LOTGIDRAFT_229926 [Lottia gigantea]|uniref:Transcription factor IIIC subunit 5 HTH domain-containing protein n=1 Tax=Lottia gigantea TaxID=225164 RepID=V4BG97_LOTGI|nr:hypothetical protein LOTGIDRAFT_229926 [Lottia gigantea]ESP04832.1 hypothetical protein LOTGIDRAFT_229926 [Lottia gigantea]